MKISVFLAETAAEKSTLIKILLGFLKPASGSVKYNIDRKKSVICRKYANSMLLSRFRFMTLLFQGLQTEKIYSEGLTHRKKAASDIMDEFGISELNDKPH